MQVANHEPCTLIIGDVKILAGKTGMVEPEWEARCIQLAERGALKIIGPKHEPSPRERVAAMSEADRKAMLAELLGEQGVAAARGITVTGSPSTPGEVSEAVADALKAEYAKAAASMTNDVVGSVDRVRQALAEPTGVPADFGTCHVNKAKAWVNKCSDADLLTRLGNDENRETVLAAIIDRIAALKPSN